MPTLAPPKKILTVEDNAVVSADVRAILEAAGYDVCPDARDGIEALAHVRQYSPDLILLDLKLPRVDGVEAASLIREESNAPILALTGSGDPDLLERAEAAGTSGLVLKPFSEHGLLSAVRSRLALHESEDYRLRSMIETMLREGKDEHEIIRVMNAETGRSHPYGGPSLRRGLTRLSRALKRKRAR